MFGTFRVFTITSFIDTNGNPRMKKNTLLSQPVDDERQARDLAMIWRDKNETDKNTYLMFEPYPVEI